MATYRFQQVDVFTNRPFRGNPVAVVLAADDIDPSEMQRIAAWTNLSETTFLLRPTTSEADYRLRIFTPVEELPFAGHPTLGSAHAALEAGLVSAGTNGLRQECGAGVLTLRVEGYGGDRQIFVRAPEAQVQRECGDHVEDISAALDLPLASGPSPMTIEVGPVWLVALARDEEAVQRMQPDMGAVARLCRELDASGVTVFALTDGPTQVRARSFVPLVGEDPVCGSGNATVGVYLATTGLLERTGETYVASQGTEIGREGRVSVRVLEGGRQVEIGGQAVTVVEGEIRL